MFKEHLVFILIPIASSLMIGLIVDQHRVATPEIKPIEEVDLEAPNIVMEIPLRRSERVHRPAILEDYIVYL